MNSGQTGLTLLALAMTIQFAGGFIVDPITRWTLNHMRWNGPIMLALYLASATSAIMTGVAIIITINSLPPSDLTTIGVGLGGLAAPWTSYLFGLRAQSKSWFSSKRLSIFSA